MTDRPPDVVLPVRVGEPNESLRYVLRSIHQHLPHSSVWIAGYCPRWIKGVNCLPTTQNRTKWQNSTGNLRAAIDHPQVSERFVLFNDDFFVLDDLPDGMPVFHRGPVKDVAAHYTRRGIGHSRYVQGMKATLRFLERLGIHDPLSYELHVPLPMEKAKLRTALDLPVKHRAKLPVLHKRTMYGAYWHVGGERIRDVKVTPKQRTWPAEWRFLSTSSGMVRQGHPVGERLRDLFPDPSPYEQTPRRATARTTATPRAGRASRHPALQQGR